MPLRYARSNIAMEAKDLKETHHIYGSHRLNYSLVRRRAFRICSCSNSSWKFYNIDTAANQPDARYELEKRPDYKFG